MHTFTTTIALQNYLQGLQGKTIGFVPTMGALHVGHLSLIERSIAETDITVASIFVNPTQFNNTADFDKYPRTIADDRTMLERAGCHILYAPETPAEVYNGYTMQTFDFAGLDSSMEGYFRPGHFQGMANVVFRLFDIVNPNKAFFGEKDYQQLALVRHMAAKHFPALEVVACDTLRESDGLAMSSRNRRLSDDERVISSNIPRILNSAKEHNITDAKQLKLWVEGEFAMVPGIRLEYFEIADGNSLQVVDKVNSDSRMFIAAYVGDVRLIDNMAAQ
ncbi:MAG: pantoate--beta-alanine ligase [Sphingobacteriales bacterium JAD_PAG50586_3]|nr:MAG: pantoate--beta-alanine ligase [Sphingobacteriales bacterium JAD_PAG50586_3]